MHHHVPRQLLMDPTDELAQINVLIDQLIAKRTSVKAEIDAHVALMSPIRRVPTDALQDIFAACLPTAHNALIDPHEAPMLLGRICSPWRSVAYSTPNIWSSLHIPTLEGGYIPAGIEEKLEKSIQAWLARSAAYPLSISLLTFPLCSFHRIVDLVVKVSLRVRHLSLSTRPLLLGAEDFPCLESIEIRGVAGSVWKTLPLLQTPNLHKVSLELAADVSALSLRWSQLTDVDIGFYEPMANDPHSTSHSTLYQNAALEILCMCKNLARCRIRADRYVAFEPSPVLTLSYLEVLIFVGEFEHAQFMKCLVLPRLRYLGVGETQFPMPSDHSDYGWSRHDLTLTVLIPDYLPGRLLTLLALFPGVTYLQLALDLEATVLRRLTSTSLDTLCPVATHLDFAGFCEFEDVELLTFIQARMTSQHPLMGIHANFDRPMDTDIIPELQEFISVGLQVDLNYYSKPECEWKFNVQPAGRAEARRVICFEA